ncbi:hypothetical protein MR532_00725 [bacterium]|nr:hypothetical protein [bacterium]
MRKRIFTVIAAILACAGITAQDEIYCAGHLVNDGWAGEKYVLSKTSEGIYQGQVHVRECTKFDYSDTSDPNNRSQLFFYNRLGSWENYCCVGDDRFITPSCNGKKYPIEQKASGNYFECLGGTYNVILDLNEMTVQFEAVAPVWLDYVVVSGSLEGENWARPGGAYKLMHQGNGLYAGDIKLLDTGAGYGNLAIFASNYDWSNPKEGRYSYTDIQTPEYGVAYTVSRYRGDNSILLPPGEYAVTFDMDNNTVRFDAKAFYCTMPAAGYSTFYSDKSAYSFTGGVTAYAGQLDGEVLRLQPTDGNSIPAGAAVILKGEGAYTATKVQDASSISRNDLLGSDGTVEGDGNSIYVLAKKDEKVGFYLLQQGDRVPAGKAYLSTGSAAKAIYFYDEATAIRDARAAEDEVEVIYNLSGQPLTRMQRGINLVNGRKVSFK